MNFETVDSHDLSPELSPEEQQLVDKLLEKAGGDREVARQLLDDASRAVAEGLTEGDPALQESYAAIAAKDREMEGSKNPWSEYCNDNPDLLEGGAVMNVVTSPIWATFGGGMILNAIMQSKGPEDVVAGVGILLAPTIIGGVLELGKAGVARIRGFLHDMRQVSREQVVAA